MSDILKAAIIVAIAILLATLIGVFFSPYHSCVRAGDSPARPIVCARALGGG